MQLFLSTVNYFWNTKSFYFTKYENSTTTDFQSRVPSARPLLLKNIPRSIASYLDESAVRKFQRLANHPLDREVFAAVLLIGAIFHALLRPPSEKYTPFSRRARTYFKCAAGRFHYAPRILIRAGTNRIPFALSFSRSFFPHIRDGYASARTQCVIIHADFPR